MTLEAPLFTKTYDLVLWLDERTQAFPKSQRFGLAARIMGHATDRKLLKARQLRFAVERIEELGRMVGGWKKRP